MCFLDLNHKGHATTARKVRGLVRLWCKADERTRVRGLRQVCAGVRLNTQEQNSYAKRAQTPNKWRGFHQRLVQFRRNLPRLATIPTYSAAHYPVTYTENGHRSSSFLGFLAVSVFTGIACAILSVLGFGAGLWMAVLWYVIGCWIGFALPVAIYLIVYMAPKTETGQPHPGYL